MQIINRNSLARSTKTSAGYDLCADLEEPEPLEPGAIALIPTGIALRLGGADMIGKIYARSDLAVLYGVTLASGVAIVDSSYEDEIFVGLVNTGGEDFILKPMMPIAQLLFERVIHPKFEEVEGFSEFIEGSPYNPGRLH
jgi:dUTP pyrophosphatase